MNTLIVLIGLMGCSASHAAPPTSAGTVRSTADLEWTALNQARGDASPRAATLWGDRTGSGPSGFLVQFADGFSSPPHIHNVTYRAVVVSGEVHNDDASAEPMWMAPGSFWTQPQGLAHITSARGASTAYVEIDSGPYLVHPADQAQETSEKPINVDATNLVWGTTAVSGAQVAPLWGTPDTANGGVMVRMAPQASAVLSGLGSELKAVVVQGTVAHHADIVATRVSEGSLMTGSLLDIQCDAPDACELYVRTAAGLTVQARE